MLCFPGIFRGALACRASRIKEEMKLAAAHAISGIVSENELHPEYIVPSVFDKRVAKLSRGRLNSLLIKPAWRDVRISGGNSSKE